MDSVFHRFIKSVRSFCALNAFDFDSTNHHDGEDWQIMFDGEPDSAIKSKVEAFVSGLQKELGSGLTVTGWVHEDCGSAYAGYIDYESF